MRQCFIFFHANRDAPNIASTEANYRFCKASLRVMLPLIVLMNFALLLVLALTLAAPVMRAAAPAAAAKKSADPAQRHPLRGVITAVDAERSVLTVKHEAIPGVMRAMTMLFRVDAATIKTAKPGQAITALMSRQRDEWWLHEVKPAPAQPK